MLFGAATRRHIHVSTLLVSVLRQKSGAVTPQLVGWCFLLILSIPRSPLSALDLLSMCAVVDTYPDERHADETDQGEYDGCPPWTEVVIHDLHRSRPDGTEATTHEVVLMT